MFVPEHSEIFLAPYSLPLVEEMRNNNIHKTGITIRNDRIEKAPLKNLEKEPRAKRKNS